jgi:AcrR family transcriptional regulator
MGVAERRAREKQQLRSQIVEAATAIIAEEGLQNFSIRRLADRIEYSPATIYLYFKDKTALVHQICAETFEPLIARMEVIKAENLGPLETMRKCIRAYIDHGLEHPNHYYVTFCLPEAQYSDMNEAEIDAGYDIGMQTFDGLRQGVRICIEAGVIAQADVETTAQLAYMQMHGIVSALITAPTYFPWVDKQRLVDQGVEQILRGMGARV